MPPRRIHADAPRGLLINGLWCNMFKHEAKSKTISRNLETSRFPPNKHHTSTNITNFILNRSPWLRSSIQMRAPWSSQFPTEQSRLETSETKRSFTRIQKIENLLRINCNGYAPDINIYMCIYIYIQMCACMSVCKDISICITQDANNWLDEHLAQCKYCATQWNSPDTSTVGVVG